MNLPASLILVPFCFLSLACESAPTESPRNDMPTIDCSAQQNQTQSLRDKLELARNYVRASKDNFGPSRAMVIDRISVAINQLTDGENGWPMTASSGTDQVPITSYHGHPRMQKALVLLKQSADDIDSLSCLPETTRKAIHETIDQSIAGIWKAFSYNRPYSGN